MRALWHGLSALAWLALEALVLAAPGVAAAGLRPPPLRSQWLVWATLSLGNLPARPTTLRRILRQLMPPAAAELTLARSGGVGVFAVVACATNVDRLPARPRMNRDSPRVAIHFCCWG
jgi:hypothetical protein